MKKIFLFIVCVLLICLSLGCNQKECGSSQMNSMQSDNTSKQNNISSGDKTEMTGIEKKVLEEYVAKSNAVLEKNDNKANYQTKIKKTYSEKAFFDYGMIYQLYNPLVSFQQYLFTVEEVFPAECVRKMSETTVYNIYKTQENGLVYLFFQKEFDSWLLHHSVYVKKALLLSDFQSITVGNTLEEVGRVDPVALSVQEHSPYRLVTIHLLKDGVIKIDYEKNSDGIFVISKLQKSKDFKLSSKDFGTNDNDVIYNYTILPQDYIQ